MKKRTIRRAMVLSVAMAVLFALPMTALAQASRNTHGGMFGTNSAQTENKGLMKNNGIVRSGTDENPFGNQAFGATDGGVNFEAFDEPYHEAPVGAGIAILLGAGLGYAAFKRRKNAKAKSTMLLAMAGMLLLGLAQCKKDGPEREMVEITLKFTADGQKGEASPNGFLGFVDIKEVDSLSVEGEKADDGQKGEIDPENGNTVPVIYAEGDTIYVGSNGKYMGFLICQSNGTFAGSIDATAEEGVPLTFFYLGGRSVKNLSLGETASFDFSLADQWKKLPVVSCGTSVEKYTGEGTYTSYLRNQCALVRFDMAPEYYRKMTITGVKNKVTINFDGTVTPSEETGDVITHGRYGVYHYLVVPADQGIVSGTASGRGALGTFQINKAARPNGYIHGESIARVDLEPNRMQGEFTIDNAGTKVHFAPYDLTATTEDLGAHWTWKFATYYEWDEGVYGYDYSQNYYNYNSTDRACITGNGTASQNGIVDAFCWSTPSTYYGIHKSTIDNYTTDFLGNFVDWGNANIENGGGYNWFTMSRDNWRYLYQTLHPGHRFGLVRNQNDEYYILMIRPDDDDWPLGNEFCYYGNENAVISVPDAFYSAPGLALEAAAGSVLLYYNVGKKRVSTDVSHYDGVGFYTSTSGEASYPDNSMGKYTASAVYWNEGTYFQTWAGPTNESLDNARALYRSVRLVKNVNDPGGYLPTVTTDTPSNIGHTHALCGGEITDDGGHTVTAYGLQWSLNSNMTSLLGSTDYGECSTIPFGFHNITISGLEEATTYYVRAYATNLKGTAYGEVKEFTTLCDEDCDVPHTFSIGQCRKVLFAPGNLMFDPNLAGGWCFASEQWSYEGSWSVGSRVDLFNWGYWNYDDPYGSDGTHSDFGTNEFTLTSDEYTWFTLSKEEWAYLLNREKTIGRSTIKLYGYAKVNNINGLVLLPDDWDGTANSDFIYFSTNHVIQHGSWECDENHPENDWYCDYHLRDADVAASTYDCNTITYATWNNMAAAGAVFLPATGTYREYDCAQGSFSVKGAGTDLGYWSSTPNSPYDGGPNNVIGGAHTNFTANSGGVSECHWDDWSILQEAEIRKMAVRLVRDACTWNWKGGK